MNTENMPFGGNIKDIIALIEFYQKQAAEERKLKQEDANILNSGQVMPLANLTSSVLGAGHPSLAKAMQWQAVLSEIANEELAKFKKSPVVKQHTEETVEKTIEETSKNLPAVSDNKEVVAKMTIVKDHEKDENETEKADAVATKEKEIQAIAEKVETSDAEIIEEEEVTNLSDLEQLMQDIPTVIMDKVCDLAVKKGGGIPIEGEVTAKDYEDAEAGNLVITSKQKLVDGKPVFKTNDKGEQIINETTKKPEPELEYMKRHASYREKAIATLFNYLKTTDKDLSSFEGEVSDLISSKDLKDKLLKIGRKYNIAKSKKEKEEVKEAYSKLNMPVQINVTSKDGEEILKYKDTFNNSNAEFPMELLMQMDESKLSSDEMVALKCLNYVASSRFNEAINLVLIQYKDRGITEPIAQLYLRDLASNNKYSSIRQRISELILFGQNHDQNPEQYKDTAIALLKSFSKSPVLDAQGVHQREENSEALAYSSWNDDKCIKFFKDCLKEFNESNKTANAPRQLPAETKTSKEKGTNAKNKQTSSKKSTTDDKSKSKKTTETKVEPVKGKEKTTAETTGDTVPNPAEFKLKLVYKANSAKTVFDCDIVDGTKFGPKLKVKKNKSIEDAAKAQWANYFKRASNNKSLGLPAGFDKYTIGSPLTIELVEKAS